MKSGNYVPESGDIIWLNFTPKIEYEQKDKKPSVVLSQKYIMKKQIFA